MRRLLGTLFAACCLAACASAPTRTAKMAEVGVQQSTAEMRIYLHDYLRGFSGEIAAAADRVIVAEDDLSARAAALRLKANGVIAMQAAVFQHDPIAALTDAWVLTAAMARFFDDGNGKDLFRGSQPVVVEALRRLEVQVDALAQSLVGHERVDVVRPKIRRFVLDNPVSDLSFSRRSASLGASALTAAAWGTDLRQSVAQIDETARDASDRLTIYAEQLPQVARWQAEMLLIDAQHEFLAKPFATLDHVDADIGALDQRLGVIHEDIDAIGKFVNGTPTLVANERALLLESFARERAMIFASVDSERVATLASLTAERETILAAVAELRRASFADLRTETVHSLDRIDKLSMDRVRDLSRLSQEAIDRLFWRALELLLVACAAITVLTLVLRQRQPRGADRVTEPRRAS